MAESPSALLERAAARLEELEAIQPDATWPLAAWMRNTARIMLRERAVLHSPKSGRDLFENKYRSAIEFAQRILGEAPPDFYDEPFATPESRQRLTEAYTQAASNRPQGLINAMAAEMWEKCGDHGTNRLTHPSWGSFEPSDAEKAKWHALAEVAFDVVKPTLDGWKADVNVLKARIAELESAVSTGEHNEDPS